MIPAKTTPQTTANTDFLKSRSKKEAARVPVQAPVPGKGIQISQKDQTHQETLQIDP